MRYRFVWTIGLAIIGQVLYHLSQRSVPRDASPLLVLAIAYLAACILCLASAPATSTPISLNGLRSAAGWSTWALALSIVAIEIGYLLAYRSGWPIGIAFAVAGSATTVVLAIIGMTAFGDLISTRRLIGLGFACVSLWLMAGGKSNH